MVLVGHAPDTMLSVVKNTELGLTPQRRAKVLQAPASDDCRKHVVLNARPD